MADITVNTSIAIGGPTCSLFLLKLIGLSLLGPSLPCFVEGLAWDLVGVDVDGSG